MAANTTPHVFYLHEHGRSDELRQALALHPEANHAAVLDALPYLGRRALKQHEPVIRKVADRVEDVTKMMHLLATLETLVAKPKPVSDITRANLAVAYFERTGTTLSLTTDTAQQWLLPGTELRMPALQACNISRQVVAAVAAKAPNTN